MSQALPDHIVPVNAERHRQAKLKTVDRFDFAKGHHIVAVTVHEFARCASIFPIVFIKDDDSKTIKPAVLLGLEPGKNLFVIDGQWGAAYVPAILRRYPFLSVVNEAEKKLIICVDESSGLINDLEGSRLFTDEGQPTEAFEKAKKFLGEVQAMDDFTGIFVKELDQLGLFRDFDLQVNVQGQKRNLKGLSVIDEKKLFELSDADFLSLRDKKYLGPIFGHLTSLGQVEKLTQLANSKLGQS